ncbi:MAG: AAA family ATPase [Gemmatimonadota bacterium]|nr:AAA family ATPase [Gemmatimonadota bacterium]
MPTVCRARRQNWRYCGSGSRVRFHGCREPWIVVGANGSGKSTLFDVFSFLKDALTRNVAVAVTRRGGYRELVSRGSDGPIQITVWFRESGGRLTTYHIEVAMEKGRIVVAREVLRCRRGRCGKPRRPVNFEHGEGSAITNEPVYGEEGAQEQREEFKLDDPSVPAIKGLGQFRRFRVACRIRRVIETWHVADAIPAAVEGAAKHVSMGRNLASVASVWAQAPCATGGRRARETPLPHPDSRSGRAVPVTTRAATGRSSFLRTRRSCSTRSSGWSRKWGSPRCAAAPPTTCSARSLPKRTSWETYGCRDS